MALEVFVQSCREDRAHAHHSVECVCSAAEVGDSTQEFERVSLLLKRIISGSVAEYDYTLGNSVYLEGIVSAINDLADDLHGSADTGLFEVTLALFDYDL